MSNEITVIRSQINDMDAQFTAGLPAHIPIERFKRVAMTAIQGNTYLLKCERKSLFEACVKASQDGLLPDGREGALVPFKGKVQWMPMIAGIRKKVRNSGEISTWDVQAVYENDEFDFELGDSPFIKHKPTLKDRGELIAVYSVATLKDGEKSRDVMGIDDVEKIRSLSQSKNGPWSNPLFYAEMAKKTVARRHSKVLPMSTDLDDLIRSDDKLYDLDAASDATVKTGDQSLASKMEAATALSPPEDEPHDETTGEVSENETSEAEPEKEEKPAPEKEKEKPKPEPDSSEKEKPAEEKGTDDTDVAYSKGQDSFNNGLGRRAVPAEYKQEGREADRTSWEKGFDDAAEAAGA